MKVDKFCELLKRYSIKFEHHHICTLKEDLNDEKHFGVWMHLYGKYLMEFYNEIQDDDK